MGTGEGVGLDVEEALERVERQLHETREDVRALSVTVVERFDSQRDLINELRTDLRGMRGKTEDHGYRIGLLEAWKRNREAAVARAERRRALTHRDRNAVVGWIIASVAACTAVLEAIRGMFH